jgi:hypothetical protein
MIYVSGGCRNNNSKTRPQTKEETIVVEEAENLSTTRAAGVLDA